MIKQLRPFHTPDELAEIYAQQYDHRRWEDHRIRVAHTIHHARWLRDHVNARTVADLSCGDGAILEGLHMSREKVIFGDYVANPRYDRQCDLDEPGALDGITVDMYISSETLEHLRDPSGFLKRLRPHTFSLLLTTPEGEENAVNPEHYWGWDSQGVRELLNEAGFTPVFHVLLDPGVPGGYVHQIWGCV